MADQMKHLHAARLFQLPTFSKPQAGAAIIMAMLIMALSTMVISGLFLRQQVTIRSVENRLALSQTRWIERAAVDWARVILRQDARISPGVDHLGEVWALPVAETKMDETVTAGGQIDDGSTQASISGQIVDAQSLFNLANLLDNNGALVDSELTALRKLFSILSVEPGLADLVGAHLLKTRPRVFEGQTIAPQELPLKRISDLSRIEGFTSAVLAKVEGFLVALQVRTTVNLNTASAEVLSARVPNLDLGSAKAFVSARERAFFKQRSDAERVLPLGTLLPAQNWAVESQFFLVRGLVKYDRVVARSDSLLKRVNGSGNSGAFVEVLWQDRY